MYTPFKIGFNLQYGPYAHFGYWTNNTRRMKFISQWFKEGFIQNQRCNPLDVFRGNFRDIQRPVYEKHWELCLTELTLKKGKIFLFITIFPVKI